LLSFYFDHLEHKKYNEIKQLKLRFELKKNSKKKKKEKKKKITRKEKKKVEKVTKTKQLQKETNIE